MAPKVSVVITAYNIAPYIGRCLDSVAHQTLSDIEIIVINDGSQDDTLSVIEQYRDADSRIIVIDKPNQGLTLARRSGVEMAKGAYILHLDGDDYLELNALELLYDRGREMEADIVVLDFWFDYGDRAVLSHTQERVIDSPIAYLRAACHGQEYWAVWTYMAKRSLYDLSTLQTPMHINYGEDAIVTTQLLLKASRVSIINTPLLHYIQRPNSITRQPELSQKHYDNLIEFPSHIRRYVEQAGYGESFVEELSLIQLRSYVDVYLLGARTHLWRDIVAVAQIIRLHPSFISMLPKRLQRVVKVYLFSPCCARIRYQYYICRSKL